MLMFMRSIRRAAKSIVCASLPLLLFSGESLAQISVPLVDIAGDTVVLWDGKKIEGMTYNAYTGEFADGSEIAKIIRPGLIRVIDAATVWLSEVDEDGNPMPPGEGRLVSNFGVVTADGDTPPAGDSLETVSVITEGFVKNPGPDAVSVFVAFGPNTETYRIEPGDGLFVGSVEEALAIANPSHESGCICDCKIGDTAHTITSACPGCGAGDQAGNCCCERLQGGQCVVRNSDGSLSGRGSTRNCDGGLIPTDREFFIP